MKLEEAIALAAKAHAGQTDRQGAPYILHCLRVMGRICPQGSAFDSEAMVVGVLHDVLEDTETRLVAEDFSYPQWIALQLLTREEKQTYEDYIANLCKATGPSGVLARRVKLADLADNLDRINGLKEPKRSLLKARYQAATNALQGFYFGSKLD